jgi:hypothetical protein
VRSLRISLGCIVASFCQAGNNPGTGGKIGNSERQKKGCYLMPFAIRQKLLGINWHAIFFVIMLL